MSGLTVALDALATYRLTRLLIEDTFPPIARARAKLQARYPVEGEEVTEEGVLALHVDDLEPGQVVEWEGIGVAGERVAIQVTHTGLESWVAQESTAVGELIRCPWCLSVWIGAGVLAARAIAPRRWDPIARMLAFSAVAGMASAHE